MDSPTLRDWLALFHCLPVASRHWQALLEVCGSPSKILQEPPGWYAARGMPESFTTNLQAWQQGGSRIHRQVEHDLNWAEQPDSFILVADDPFYPGLLSHIPDPPPVLYGRGDASLLGQAQLAVVGSRKASIAAIRHARHFAAQLTRQGFVITSGLAWGIDSEAHRAALDAGGKTIAVLGGGVERVYPKQHGPLAEEIVQSGCLISEFPRKFPAQPWCFPRRNRIVTGLSAGVLVVEAALASGSLISAGTALEQGREVFAIPGSIDNPNAAGCHSLIRQGASLVEAPEEIIDAFQHLPGIFRNQPSEAQPLCLSENEEKVLDTLEDIPMPHDLLCHRTGLSGEEVATILIALEVQGLVSTRGAGAARTGRTDTTELS